jgi:hypothetical protein
MRQVQEEKLEPDKMELHYFWGSRFALQIYFVFFAAIVLQRLWVLHGITLVIAGRMLERTAAWSIFIVNSRDFKKFWQQLYWWSHFALAQADKTLQGSSTRGWMTGMSFRLWNSFGKSYLFSVMRSQYRDVNTAVLQEKREMLERSQRVHQQMVEQRKRMKNVIHKRSSELLAFRPKPS